MEFALDSHSLPDRGKSHLTALVGEGGFGNAPASSSRTKNSDWNIIPAAAEVLENREGSYLVAEAAMIQQHHRREPIEGLGLHRVARGIPHQSSVVMAKEPVTDRSRSSCWPYHVHDHG